MAKKPVSNRSKALIGRRARIIVLILFIVLGAGVVILVGLSVILPPKDSKPGLKYGVGADGFQAFIEEKGNLGVVSVVNKDQVITALEGKAKSVGDPETSKVFNLNGNRGQTLTFPFVRADGAKSTLYVDMRLYKNLKALDDDHIYVATAKAGTVNGHPAYYRHAQTISSNREYHIMVVNGLRAYRFVIAQPARNITITEIAADAALKKLAQEAKL